eukprot:2555043-Pleurochrysis_carterae.AAC.5
MRARTARSGNFNLRETVQTVLRIAECCQTGGCSSNWNGLGTLKTSFYQCHVIMCNHPHLYAWLSVQSKRCLYGNRFTHMHMTSEYGQTQVVLKMAQTADKEQRRH